MCRRSFSFAMLYFVAACFGNSDRASAGVMVFTDKAAWESALNGQYQTESFDDAQLNLGVSFSSSEPGHFNPALGYYQDVLTSTSANEPFTIWSFSPPMRAYGGDWTLGGPGGSGNSLLVYIEDTSEFVGAIGNSYGGEFWGFISDAPFTEVKLIGGTGSHQQIYKLDNMVYSSVPEPGALCLLGTGVAGLLFLAKRIRNIG
jgi:hypothetical protein